MASVMSPMDSVSNINDPNVVKVLVNNNREAITFFARLFHFLGISLQPIGPSNIIIDMLVFILTEQVFLKN